MAAAITGPTEIENHFRALHEATDLPLFVYDIPVCVHVKVPVDLMMKLGREGVIAGCKDSSADDVSFRRLALANEETGYMYSTVSKGECSHCPSYRSSCRTATSQRTRPRNMDRHRR